MGPHDSLVMVQLFVFAHVALATEASRFCTVGIFTVVAVVGRRNERTGPRRSTRAGFCFCIKEEAALLHVRVARRKPSGRRYRADLAHSD